MNQLYVEKLALLRQHVPVGVRHGLALLTQAQGDVDQAAAAFRQEMVALVVHKTNVAEAAAALHLQQAAFDVARALKTIEETQFSLTERILRRYRDKREAIRIITCSVVENRQLTSGSWLDFEELQQLPSALGCVLMVNEWLNYADWESWDAAVYFNLDVIITLLEKQLQLPQASDALRQLRRAELAQAPVRKVEMVINGSFRPKAELIAAEQDIEGLEPLLIDTLYAFVLKHIHLFP